MSKKHFGSMRLLGEVTGKAEARIKGDLATGDKGYRTEKFVWPMRAREGLQSEMTATNKMAWGGGTGQKKKKKKKEKKKKHKKKKPKKKKRKDPLGGEWVLPREALSFCLYMLLRGEDPGMLPVETSNRTNTDKKEHRLTISARRGEGTEERMFFLFFGCTV